ncbi:MAG: hypothetical protein V7607_2587 [Solirubrobacteraceae bacterium]
MSAPDSFDIGLLKALGHPLRLRLLESITDRGEASPKALALELNQPLATVSHHIRVLRDLGWIEIVRTEPRRGALEHFYRAARRPFIEDAEWQQVPLVMRRGLARQTFRRIFGEASSAGADGGFDDPGAHLDRVPLELDERGWRELSEILSATLKAAEEVERRSEARNARPDGSDGVVRRSELAILHFGVEAPIKPRERGREGRPRRPPRPALP